MELPSSDTILMNGVRWGAIDAFPTPAYWQYQVIARRLVSRPTGYKLGGTLTEEVAACLLGGHGIPASVGIAAYERLRKLGAFTGTPPSEEQFEAWLREPLQIGQRQVRYRFAAQKARYLAAALRLVQSSPTFQAGKQLRDWLMQLPGIGPKTASWIARNWMDADDVAILDIHIVRVGRSIGIFPQYLTVERHYFELESLFLQFSQALDVRASELDAVIWYEMASSPRMARVLINQLSETPTGVNRRQRKQENRQAQMTFA
uniref:HhH-GPD domain-containing protein n=1 Tax=mine drainage metagenome TaxID=410659 RepID=E6QWK0_9ZZZZ